MKLFVGEQDDRGRRDEDDLDWRDKAKITVAVLIGGALMLAGLAINELFYVAFYGLLALTYAVQRLRLWRREARARSGVARSRGNR